MTEIEAKGFVQGKLDCMKKCGVFNKEDIENKDLCDDCHYCYSQGNFGQQKEAFQMAINALEKIQQYRALGTVEELKAKTDELERWHTDHTVEEIKNVFANTSTLICHNCDHKDEYIIELESEVEELLEAKEKQIQKKPIFQFNLSDTVSRFECSCGKIIKVRHDIGIMDNNDAPNYCDNCGQKLDFGE